MIRCPYLIKHLDNTTSCEIYENRIGTIVIETSKDSWACGYRKDQKYQIKGCPYNHLIKKEK